jgi:hypothetical protein
MQCGAVCCQREAHRVVPGHPHDVVGSGAGNAQVDLQRHQNAPGRMKPWFRADPRHPPLTRQCGRSARVCGAPGKPSGMASAIEAHSRKSRHQVAAGWRQETPGYMTPDDAWLAAGSVPRCLHLGVRLLGVLQNNVHSNAAHRLRLDRRVGVGHVGVLAGERALEGHEPGQRGASLSPNTRPSSPSSCQAHQHRPTES